MGDKLYNERPDKYQLMNLISQSFQTNLNLLSYIEKSGIVLNQKDWNQIMQSPITNSDFNQDQQRNYTSNVSENKYISRICRDNHQERQLLFLRDTIIKKESELGMIRESIRELEVLANNFSEILKPADPNETEQDVSQRIGEIDAQLDKYQILEQSHLNSKEELTKSTS
jgi:hypothetical protein